MSDATKDLKDTLHKELAHLAEVRDELRVQLALAKAEAKTEWNRLETSWDRIQGDLKLAGEHAKEHAKEQVKEPAQQISHAVVELVQELKRGYEKLRAQLKS